MILLDQQQPEDIRAVESLLDEAFGPARHAKTAQRLRDGRRPSPGLAFVARYIGPWGAQLVGTLSFWDVRLGPAVPGLMLGPIAVDEEHRSSGIGALMIRRGLEAARAKGHGAVVLVGDAPYYERFGFTCDLTRNLVLPGPVDEARFLGLELAVGAYSGAAGLIRPAGRLLPAELTKLAA